MNWIRCLLRRVGSVRDGRERKFLSPLQRRRNPRRSQLIGHQPRVPPKHSINYNYIQFYFLFSFFLFNENLRSSLVCDVFFVDSVFEVLTKK